MPVEIDNLQKILSRLQSIEPNFHLPKPNLTKCIEEWYFPRLFSSALIDKESSEWEYWLTDKVRTWLNIDKVNDARIEAIITRSLRFLPDEEIENNLLSENVKKEIYRFRASHRLLATNPHAALHQRMQAVIDLYRQHHRPAIDLTRFNNAEILHNQSLFHNLPPQPVEEMDPALLNALFNDPLASGMDLRRLLDYTKTYPTAAELQHYLTPQQIDQLMQQREAFVFALEQAIKEEMSLQAIIDSGRNPDAQLQQQAKQALEKLAGETAAEIKNLAAGQRKLIFGGVAAVTPKLKLDKIGNDGFYKVLQNILARDGDGVSLEQTLSNMVPQVSRNISEMVPTEACDALRSIIENGLMQQFFSGLSRSLTEGKPLWQRVAIAPLEFGRQSLEDTVSQYCTMASREVSAKLAAALTPELLEELRVAIIQNRFDQALATKVTLFLTNKYQQMQGHIANIINNITGTMPKCIADIFRAFDLGELGSPEQKILFEFERQANDKFTISVFACGAAVMQHPHIEDRDGLSYQNPFQIRNVEMNKLNPEHLLRLLSYRVWPQWKPGVRYSVQDVYKGFLASMEGQVVPPTEVPHAFDKEAHQFSGMPGIFRIYTNFRLLPAALTRDKRKLYYLGLQKKAIRDIWTHVVHTPNYLRVNKEARHALLKASKVLGTTATELFEDSARISLEEYTQIFATIKVISNTISALEQQENPERSRRPSALIPAEVMPHLYGLIVLTQGSKYLLEMIKGLIVGALGEEVGSAIDEVIADIFPDPFREQVPEEVAPLRSMMKWISDELSLQVYNHFGFSMDLIQNPTYFKVAYCVSRAVLFILLPGAAIKLSITIVAQRALSSLIEWCFPEAFNKLSRLKIQLFAQIVSDLLLSQEQKTQFNQLIQTWRNAISRTGRIQYENNSNITAGRSVEFKWMTPIIQRNITQRSVEEGQPFNSDYIVLNQENFCEELERWWSISGVPNPNDSFYLMLRRLRFYNGQIKQLPVPLPGNQADFWSAMTPEQAQESMESLAELSLDLYKAAQYVQNPSKEIVHRTVINLYKILAIIDKLARKFPETHLTGFTVNAWALAWWPKHGLFRLIDYEYLRDPERPRIPSYQAQLLGIQNYFGIDSERDDYTDEEVEKLASNCLFFEGRNEKVNRVTSSGCSGAGTTAYFNVLMQDPNIVNLMTLMGVKPTDPSIDKYSLLYANPHTQQIKGILPRPVHLMRMTQFLAAIMADFTHHKKIKFVDDFQVQRATEDNPFRPVLQAYSFGLERMFDFMFKISNTYTDESGISIGEHDRKELDPLYKEVPYTYHTYAIGNYVRKMYARKEHLPLNLEKRKNWNNRIKEVNPNSSLTEPTSCNQTALMNFMHTTPRSQQAIANKVNEFPSVVADTRMIPQFLQKVDQAIRDIVEAYTNMKPPPRCKYNDFARLPDELRRVIEMIRTHKSDEAVRTISFFTQNIDKLGKIDFLVLLSCLLSHDRVLHRQLAAHPEFCRTLGQFFHRAMEHLSLEPDFSGNVNLAVLGHNPWGLAPIIRIGVLLKMSVEAIIPNGGQWFPDFRRKILEDAEPKSLRSLLALPYLSVDYFNASGEVRRQATSDICYAIAVGNSEQTEIAALSDEVISLWGNAIAEELSDQEFRNEVLTRAAKHEIQPNETLTWAGEYPVYRSGPFIFNFRCFPALLVQDNLEKTAIYRRLQDIIGRAVEPPIVNEHGIYKVQQLNFYVEVHDRGDARERTLRFSKEIENRKYYWVNSSDDLQEGEHITYWLEEGQANGYSKLAILEAGELKSIRTVRRNANNENLWEPVVYEVSADTVQIDGVECRKEKLNPNASHGLSMLAWLQPLSSIEGYYAIEPPYDLKQIKFTNLNLTFNVKMHRDGQPRAMYQDSNFYIAPVQNQVDKHPALAKFGRYLLLENKHGEKKVLVPADSLRSQTLSTLLGFLAGITLSPFLQAMVDGLLNETMDVGQGPHTYHTYTFDKDGRLTGEDPLAILHLLSMHLQDLLSPTASLEEVIHYLNAFEMCIEETNDFPNEVFEFCSKLELCALAANNDEFTRLALRFVAIRTRFLKKTDDAKTISISMLSLIAMQWNYSRFNPKERFAIIPLDERQEFSVLRGISHTAELLFAKAPKGKDKESFIEKYGMDSVANGLLVLPSIARRHEFLSYKYEPKSKQEITIKGMLRHMWFESTSLMETSMNAESSSSVGVHLGQLWDNALSNNNGSIKFDFLDDIVLSDTWEAMPLTFSEITTGHLKRHFFQYYRLAMEDMPECCKRNQATKDQFIRDSKYFRATLKLMVGQQYGDRGDNIIDCLRKVSMSPGSFLLAHVVEYAMSECRNLELEKQEMEKEIANWRVEHAQKIREEHEKQLNKAKNWQKYYLDLISDHAKGNFIFHTIFSKESCNILSSLVQNHGRKALMEVGAYSATGLVLDSVVAPFVMPLGRLGLLAQRTYPKMLQLQESAQQEREEMEKSQTVDMDPLPANAQLQLQNVDNQLEKACQSLLADHFRPVPEANQKEAAHRRIGPLVPPNQENATLREYARVNEDLNAYYNNPYQPVPVYEFKSQRDLYQLKIQLEAARDRWKVQTDTLEADIIQFSGQINQNEQPDHILIPQLLKQGFKKKERVAHAQLVQLLQHLLHPDHELLKLTNLPPERLPQLKLHLMHYMVNATRLQQMEKALKKLSQIEILEANDPNITILTAELIFELSRKRAYKLYHPNPTEQEPAIPARFIAGYLLLEYGRDIMIWQSQLPQLQTQLLEHFKHNNICVQQRTGSGKSAVNTPIVGAVLSTRKQAMWHVLTDALKTSSIKTIIYVAKTTLGTTVHVMEMDRYKPVSATDLSELYQTISGAVQFGRIMASGKRDPQALQLRFIEEVWKYAHQGKRDQQKEEEFLAYALVLNLINGKVCANLDELHKLERRTDELNFPIGDASTIQYFEKRYSKVFKHTYHMLLDDPVLKQLDDLRDQNQPKLDSKVYDEQIKVRMAQLISQDEFFDIAPENRERLIAYLCNEEAPIPDFVYNSKLRKEIGLAKGFLNEICYDTRILKVNAGFGKSDVLTAEFVIPYVGNKNPSEGSTYRSPFVAAVRTYRYFALTGLNSEQTKKLHHKMHQMAIQEAIEKQIPKEATEAAQAFYNWCRAYFRKKYPNLVELPCKLSDFPETMNEQQLNELTAAFNVSNAPRLEYPYHFAVSDIPYFLYNLCSNSQNAISMYAKNVGGTASPNEDETFFRGTQNYYAPGTTGAFLDHLGNIMTPENTIEIDAKTPLEMATAILQRVYTEESRASYMADPSGLLNGLDNEVVARMLLNHCTWYDGVVFFSKEGAQLILERDDNKPKPLSESIVPLKKRCGFFDEVNALGQDIPMDPEAVVVGLISAHMNREQAQQGLLGRFRNCKQGGKQKFIAVVNKPDRILISGDQPLTANALIPYIQINETKPKANNSYGSAHQQIHDVTRSTVVKAMCDRMISSGVDAMIRCFLPFESLLVQKTESDPFVLFAHPKKVRNPYEVFETLKEKQFNLLRNSRVFAESELKESWSKYAPLGQGTYPSTVKVYDNNLDYRAYEHNTAQVVVQTIEQQQNRQNLVEQEQHQNQSLQNMACDMPPKGEEFAAETAWLTGINYFSSVNWLRIITADTKNNFQAVSFYNVEDSIKHLGVTMLKEVHSAFKSKSMWWTHNFMGVQELSRTLAPPGGQRHIPMLELLVIGIRDQQGNITKMTTGAITQAEADVWRKRFAEDRRATPDKRDPRISIALFDLGSSTVVDSGFNKLRDQELFKIEMFCFDLFRWKFLAGQVNIRRGLPDTIEHDKWVYDRFKQWIISNDQEKMKKAFLALHEFRGIAEIKDSDTGYLYESREKFLMDTEVE